MFERFTEGARTVVSDAVEQARALGHDPVGTQHLLLGLLNPGAGAGYQVLRDAGLQAAAALPHRPSSGHRRPERVAG
jgi:ATP-dependent Clp protease ATP-binding subunit ClpC